MADPGRLRELLLPEKRIWLRPAKNPERKTRWSAVLVESPDGDELVSLDSTLPNRLIRRALEAGEMDEFREWDLVKAEATLGCSRFDFLLTGPGERQLVLEVKSVTLVEGGIGFFPDAVTERGARHVRELAEITSTAGWNGAVLFVLQRSGADEIRAARRIDPKFAEALEEAAKAGVQVLGRRCRVYPDRVELGGPVPVKVD
jgi:sugar fermentation stimulation protein A